MSEQLTKPKHSHIGASSRYRWSKCPGSVNLSKDLPNVAGAAALEGTMAHEVIASILNSAFSKNESVGIVLSEFIKHISVYLDYVQKLKQTCEIVHVEHKFDMSDTFDGLYGTADCVGYDKANGVLHVVDYKHGEALVVEVVNNLQLEYYALGALNTLGYSCRTVQLTIIQPRAYHPDGPIRHWRRPAMEFLEVEENIISEAQDTLDPKAVLLAGSHCMFCSAKLKCPQKHTASQTQAKKEFNFYTDPKKDFEVLETVDKKNDEFAWFETSK